MLNFPFSTIPFPFSIIIIGCLHSIYSPLISTQQRCLFGRRRNQNAGSPHQMRTHPTRSHRSNRRYVCLRLQQFDRLINNYELMKDAREARQHAPIPGTGPGAPLTPGAVPMSQGPTTPGAAATSMPVQRTSSLAPTAPGTGMKVAAGTPKAKDTSKERTEPSCCV